MKRSQLRGARGQGLVETVLGSIVFVTVLLVGIHFAEVMVTSMKVSEAASAPLWDATGGLHHRIPFDTAPAQQSLTAARNEVALRYSNFDGRSVATGLPGAPAVQVLTRARDMTVRCGMGSLPPWAGTINPAYFPMFGGLGGNGGARCNAEAFVQGEGSIRFGAFLEGATGFFQAQQRSGAAFSAAGGYKVCALNRPEGLNGPCRGSLSMAIDDFGLGSVSFLGGNEGAQCPSVMYGLPCVSGNMPFWTATFLAYQASSLMFDTQSSDYEQYIEGTFYGDKPGNYTLPWTISSSPVSFHMSFTGENTEVGPWGIGGPAFTAFTPWASDPILFSWYWNGSPYLMPFGVPLIAHLNRSGECYLGRSCGSLP